MTPRNDGGAATERLWSLAAALDHLCGFVADLAGFNGKSATLVIAAPAVMAPRSLIAAVVPVLVQLLRNAVTHGVEPPLTRLVRGKTLTGALNLSVVVESGAIVFVVTDDGRGVEPGMGADASPAAAAGRGLAGAMARLAPLGGTIRSLPCQAAGARFRVTVPIAGLEVPPRPQRVADAAQSANGGRGE